MITQSKVKQGKKDLKELMTYDMQRGMLIPTEDLMNLGGYSFKDELRSNDLADKEFYFMAETLYGFMSYTMQPYTMEFVRAKIAQNDYDEQTTIARAYIALAPFWIKGGDQASQETGVVFETGVVVPPETMLNSQIGLVVKQILQAGNGTVGGYVWFRGQTVSSIEDITDLVRGEDY
jgi:hypothetical protein